MDFGVKIKVCGMRDQSNIEALVQLPVDYIGFIFYKPSPRYVGENFSKAITAVVPSGIKKVGVFVNENLSSLLKQAENHELQCIQLHGNETPDYCSAVKEKGYTIIKAFKADAAILTCETSDYRFSCDYYLFDTPTVQYGGSGQKFDWDILKTQKLYHSFFLSGGIGPQDASRLKNMDLPDCYALDINSKFEISPGLKNIGVIKAFLKELKS